MLFLETKVETTQPPTSGPTFKPENGTHVRCGWSTWLNGNTPSSDLNGGEFETIQGLKSRYGLCKDIKEIRCRLAGGIPPAPGSQELITCDVANGLRCYNRDQNNQMCNDYEVSVYCWDDQCKSYYETAYVVSDFVCLSGTL